MMGTSPSTCLIARVYYQISPPYFLLNILSCFFSFQIQMIAVIQVRHGNTTPAKTNVYSQRILTVKELPAGNQTWQSGNGNSRSFELLIKDIKPPLSWSFHSFHFPVFEALGWWRDFTGCNRWAIPVAMEEDGRSGRPWHHGEVIVSWL